MSACQKCGGHDLCALFIPRGHLINHSGRREIENEFITSYQFDFFWQHKAAKDHLRKRCRSCRFQWLERTTDDKGESK